MAISSFGGIPNATLVKQRVYYTESSTVYEGMPVCFEFDATTNWLDVDSGDSDVFGANPTRDPYYDTTTAEGKQNEGKGIRVEDPDADNLPAFAGVVCGSSPHIGETGPCSIDIYVPNGAVVPVRTDLNCTAGRTVLAVESASQELTVPLAASNAVPVAIAWETVDRSETSGIVLAKLEPNMFLRQEGDASSLIMDDDATAAETVNYSNLYFAGTGGPKRGLYAVGEIAGAGHSNYGMWKFRTYLSAAASQTVHSVCANLHFKDDAEITDTGEWASAPLYVTVETEVTTSAPDLSGGSVAGIYLGYYIDESTGAPSKAYAIHTNNHASYNWDGIIRMSAGDFGDTASGADEANHVIGFDGDGTTRKIPVLIDGTTYYFLVGTAIQGVVDA